VRGAATAGADKTPIIGNCPLKFIKCAALLAARATKVLNRERLALLGEDSLAMRDSLSEQRNDQVTLFSRSSMMG
jgi:hypothetical protein